MDMQKFETRVYQVVDAISTGTLVLVEATIFALAVIFASAGLDSGQTVPFAVGMIMIICLLREYISNTHPLMK